ncbi:DNA adenine methylase [Prosthecobacter algae]|uniref:site-specific DNA-methyltransferase (adenine-specific) n=1 Tax=Prosthecobacter algae TaxID=1144682 RepID=A0ABP9P820_9BACT
MKTFSEPQLSLISETTKLPDEIANFPRFRYMGSKFRLLPWIHETLAEIGFETATDAFSGSGVVSYLLKAMGKQVRANDTLAFPSVLTSATVANNATRLNAPDLELLLSAKARSQSEQFIRKTYEGIFYTPEELSCLDDLWSGIRQLESPFKRAMALAALLRSAIKRQPRGLFTISDPTRYQDGRRDLQLNIREHFIEQVAIYNAAVFSNGQRNSVTSSDVFHVNPGSDLVYMDPPYVPLADDNCYIKRYHFLEGLACYWEGKELMMHTKVRKIVKPFTPFSYRQTALEAFDRLFRHFSDSIQVLSYSSNAYPDLPTLCSIMRRYKKSVEVLEKNHRYHFGTHAAAKRNVVKEYLIIGS